MPVKSKRQARFLEHKFGHTWMKKHHFGGKRKGLPEKAPAKKQR